MSGRLRILLALWAALAAVGGAVAGEAGCCGPLCCDEPCPTTASPAPCDCCVLSAPVTDDPGLVPKSPAAPTPAATATLAAPTAFAGETPFHARGIVALTPYPPPSRPTVLRI